MRAAVVLLGPPLLGLYLLQLASPLRLNTDVTRLLAMAVSAHEGKGYLVEGAVDQFPLGYPRIVRLMIDLGVAGSPTLIGLNLLCLALTLLAAARWCRDLPVATATPLIVMLPALSWVTIKHVTLPLTEMPYLAASAWCLESLRLHERGRGLARWGSFAAALGLAAFAMHVRSIGVSLLPVIAWAALTHPDVRVPKPAWLGRISGKVFVILAGSAVLLLLSALAVAISRGWEPPAGRPGGYLANLRDSLVELGPFAFLGRNLEFRVREFGELLINLPVNRLGSLEPFFQLAGLAAWAGVIAGATILLSNGARPPWLIHLVVHSGLMLLWPFRDARFQLPVLPALVICGAMAAAAAAERLPRLAAMRTIFVGLYVATGLAALLYSTSLSLSGRDFANRYGDNTIRPTYRRAFGFEPEGTPMPPEVRTLQLDLLRRLEPLAHPR
jgi:hypothetical protein